MNRLEVLANEGKCELLMPRVAWNEAEYGHNTKRKEKTWSYFYVGLEHTPSQQSWFKKIEAVVFPNGAVHQNQINDIWVLVTARELRYPLVTDDGASRKQAGGMLGNRDELRALGVAIVRDSEAVQMVESNEKT